MAKKNETVVLALALLITLAALGGVAVWATRFFQADLGRLTGRSDSTQLPAGQGDTFTAFAAQTEVPLGTWQYGGSTAWAAIRQVVDQKIVQDLPKFQLAYTQDPIDPPSSGSGIKMLIGGQIAFAQSSRPIAQEEYDQAAQRGFQIKQIPVAYDAIVAVVHPSLEVAGLTTEQLVSIYTGAIANWREVGGPDLAVQPYSGDLAGGAPVILRDFFPSGADFGQNVIVTETPSQAIQAVAAQPTGGIYIASARTLIGQCSVKPLPIGRTSAQLVAPYAGELVPPEACPERRNQLDREVIRTSAYPLTRRLFVVVREDGSNDTQVGSAYAELLLTAEGQRLIEEAGFVALRSF